MSDNTAEWRPLRLDAICSKRSEGYLPIEGGALPYIGLEHIQQGIPALESIGTESDVSSSKSKFEQKDVLFGKLRPYLRKAVIPGFAGVCSTDILVFIPHEHTVPEYLLYLCHSDQFLKHAKATTTGVQHPRTSWPSLAEFLWNVPGEDEQRQIGRVLATVQRGIEQQQAIIATTRELKRSLMHKLFTEGLRGEAQKSTEIGLVPESWDLVKLGDCCGVVSSALPYTDLEKAVDYEGDDAVDVMGVKVSDMNLPGNELAFNRANLERKMPPSILRKRLIAAGTIVFPKRGAAIATNKKRIATGWTVLDPNLIGVVAGERLNADFLFHQFQRVDLRKITDPGPTPQLNKKDLLPLWLPVPKTLDEQMEIATSIGAVQSKIDSECAKLSLMNDLFKTLLHQLMTAQLRVNDLDLDALGVPTLD